MKKGNSMARTATAGSAIRYPSIFGARCGSPGTKLKGQRDMSQQNHDDMQETQTADLTAQRLSNGWCVTDDHGGGTWWPKPEAAIEIKTSINPAGTAVRICETQPKRGTWHN